MQNFAELQLTKTTMAAVQALGFETPTPVQAQAIPELLAGRDLIGQARTGTGKTAAFGIPLVERLAGHQEGGIQALVLVPTRELAVQVSEQLRKLARGTQLSVVQVFGGVGHGGQREALSTRRTVILVATPGRLLDHIAQRNARLDQVRMLVLDEADRMLDMGFLPDVERIIKLTPQQRQTALFSATVPEPIRQLSKRFLRNPHEVRTEDGPVATPNAEQFKIELQRSQKTQGLLALLKKENPECAIVFTRTKHLARRLAQQVGRAGYPSVALQGNMSQSQRDRAMDDFRKGKATILVATDIASRGLDVPEVSHVVNYDVPVEPEAYVHRIGRTARMGRTGRAFTFVQSDQRRELYHIERLAGTAMQAYDLGELPPPLPEPQNPNQQRSQERREQRRGGGRSFRPRFRDDRERRGGGHAPQRRDARDDGVPRGLPAEDSGRAW